MDVTVIKSKRKSFCIQIRPDLSVVVRAPNHASKKEIELILAEKENWIRKTLNRLKENQRLANAEEISYLSSDEIVQLRSQAKKYIPERVAYFSKLMNVSYGQITIRCQKTRWGSCSSKGNLNFNCLLVLMPPEIMDSVVVHELCHRKQMNHSRLFWAEVEKVLPDYQIRRKWLKENGRRYLT